MSEEEQSHLEYDIYFDYKLNTLTYKFALLYDKRTFP